MYTFTDCLDMLELVAAPLIGSGRGLGLRVQQTQLLELRPGVSVASSSVHVLCCSTMHASVAVRAQQQVQHSLHGQHGHRRLQRTVSAPEHHVMHCKSPSGVVSVSATIRIDTSAGTMAGATMQTPRPVSCLEQDTPEPPAHDHRFGTHQPLCTSQSIGLHDMIYSNS
jgi:hypothetical protein